jgi:hypothetical protein
MSKPDARAAAQPQPTQEHKRDKKGMHHSDDCPLCTQRLIEGSPEPLRKLAARLTELLDDDHWNEIETYLLALACRPAPPAPGLREELRKLVLAIRNEVINDQELIAQLIEAACERAALTAPVPTDGEK